MSEKQNFDRRRFLGAAAITLAAGPLVMLGSAQAESRKKNESALDRVKGEPSSEDLTGVHALPTL